MKAFPCKTVVPNGMHSSKTLIHSGMDLRDYFAGQVICHSYPSYLTSEELADQAYEIADAMIDRRKNSRKGV